MRRRAVAPPVERLQLPEDVTRQRMPDNCRVNSEIEAGNSVIRSGSSSDRGSAQTMSSSSFSVSRPAGRVAARRAQVYRADQREENTGHGDQVLDFLPMTGEISLRGIVPPVGGIKEKVIAAAQAEIKRVLLPARNKRDFDDIPEQVRKQLRISSGSSVSKRRCPRPSTRRSRIRLSHDRLRCNYCLTESIFLVRPSAFCEFVGRRPTAGAGQAVKDPYEILGVAKTSSSADI